MADETETTAEGGSQLIANLWRYRVSSLVIVLVCLALSVVFSQQLQGPASASTRLTLDDPRVNTVLRQGVMTETSFLRFVEQRADVATSNPVLRAAVERLAEEGLATDVAELRSRVRATGDERGGFTITASGGDREWTVMAANAVADAYRAATREQIAAQREDFLAAVEDARETVADRAATAEEGSPEAQAGAEALARLEVRIADILVDASTFDDGVSRVARATPDGVSGGTTPVRNALAATFLGLLLAAGIAYVRSERLPGTDTDHQPGAEA